MNCPIVVTSDNKVRRDDRIMIIVGNRVVGTLPRNAITGQLVHIKMGSHVTTNVYDGSQWQSIK